MKNLMDSWQVILKNWQRNKISVKASFNKLSLKQKQKIQLYSIKPATKNNS